MDKILIVVDMQNDFIDGIFKNPDAQAIIPKVAQKIENWDGNHIICTQDSHMPPFYMNFVEGKVFPLHCELQTAGWELNPAINIALGAYIRKDFKHNYIEKLEKDTFISFEIENYLLREVEPQNPFEIHIIGLCNDICIISNALFLRSVFPLANIIVDAQCCAGTTPEQHQAALNIMKACCIEVINEN